MSRPRKHNKHLPAYVRIKNGAYLYRDKKLCRVSEGESRMYEKLAEQKKLKHIGAVPAAVAAYKLDYLPTLSDSARKEHSRYLDVFAEEFDRFNVADITAPDIRGAIRDLFPKAPHAARHFRSRVYSFFTWAITEAGLCAINPVREIVLPKPRAKKTQWTDSLFWSVHDQLDAMHQCYHLLSFLLYQRTTDIRHLKKTDVQPPLIRFAPSKVAKLSGAEIDIVITPAIQSVLDRAAAIGRDWKVSSPYVIHTRQGTAYTASGIRSAYRRVDAPSPKSLLPYAMQHAKRKGATVEQLKVGRGHTTIATTEGYLATHDVPVSEVLQQLPPRVLPT